MIALPDASAATIMSQWAKGPGAKESLSQCSRSLIPFWDGVEQRKQAAVEGWLEQLESIIDFSLKAYSDKERSKITSWLVELATSTSSHHGEKRPVMFLSSSISSIRIHPLYPHMPCHIPTKH